MIGGGPAENFLHHARKAQEDLDGEIECPENTPDVDGTWYKDRYIGYAYRYPYSAIARFMEHWHAYLPRTCRASLCISWFKQGRLNGSIVMWPGSGLAFSTPQWEDSNIEYHSGNWLGFLDSGVSDCEFSIEEQLTAYRNLETVNKLP
ncbi:hypothetical protein BDV41DRAFT_572862 [Aspergillus transmontanensis]|uniref:Uncharacterized protein n=1 Tax=Aspergillus transmontanensis TaxID=1034304 RepID=A0A5N6WAM3_9EURO|nr:hypothetical protein BDV41DRAFT_572862 [Aspergillus transmontanensis]